MENKDIRDIIDYDIKELLVDDNGKLTFAGYLVSIYLSLEVYKLFLKFIKEKENK